MRLRFIRAFAWTFAALCSISVVAGSLKLAFGDPSGAVISRSMLVAAGGATALVAYPVVGALIASREPRNPVGWLLLSVGTLAFPGIPAALYADHAFRHHAGRLPLDTAAAWFSGWIGTPSTYLAVVFLPLLFPDGRLPGPRWRPFAWAAGLVVAANTFAAMFRKGKLDESSWHLSNPVGFLPTWPQAPLALAILVCILLSAASAVVRFRRARGIERLQMQWFALAGALVALGFIAGFSALIAGSFVHLAWGLAGLAFAGVPIVVGIAILRHRLYDIDLLLNRTLVYGALTACILAAYGGIVVAVGAVASGAGQAAALLAAGVVAVLFAPLRNRLQRAVNRLLYGHRDDPYAAIADLGRRLAGTLEPDEVVPAIVDAVCSALRLPYAAIELRHGLATYTLEASHGSPRGEPIALPLSHHGEQIGRLVLSPRAAGDELDESDRRLLEDLARQAGVAVRAVRLTRELQRSREELVAAREEERRRLRRDLHDGLGPTLAGIAMQLEGARLMTGRPGELEPLLAGLEEETRGAIADIRRLVYNLRPPALDDLGLIGALEQQAGQFGGRLDVSILAPAPLTGLSAAVEVAAYRITSEALTNVVRHAGAEHCDVRFELNGALEIGIRDDGRGLPASTTPGVGLTSMRERAAELGGTLTVERVEPHGTLVRARLPLGDGA